MAECCVGVVDGFMEVDVVEFCGVLDILWAKS